MEVQLDQKLACSCLISKMQTTEMQEDFCFKKKKKKKASILRRVSKSRTEEEAMELKNDIAFCFITTGRQGTAPWVWKESTGNYV